MPSRIIREGWLESERVNLLKPDEERFFLRLCLRADDFGRYHANPTLLKSNLFPLREDVRSTDMPRLLAACEQAGLIRCYDHDGKRYVEIPRFDQRMRATNSKFPNPPDICQANDGHVSGSRMPRARARSSESEAYSEAEALAVHARHEMKTSPLPTSLNTPEMLTAWERWLVYWSTSFANGRPMPEQTAHSQLKELVALGPSRAIVAIENAITKGLRKPAEPFTDRGDHRSGSHEPAPRRRDVKPFKAGPGEISYDLHGKEVIGK